MKKILYITHLSGKRVNRFWLSSLEAAHQLGYEFHLACNMKGAEQPYFDNECKKLEIFTHHIDFNRNPLNPENFKAYKELLQLMKEEKFDIIHCNTPVGGLIGRLCARKAKIPYVVYQAHGFHFWHGAPLKNWVLYYSVEKYLSKYTDALITINKEDFKLSQKFKAKKNYFVHGVGVNTDKFKRDKYERTKKRQELGLKDQDIALVSVGELNPGKNHKLIIDAINELRNTEYFPRLQLFICGAGMLHDELTNHVKSLHLENHVHLLGFRKDVQQIYDASDIFVFMSLREGLSVSLMEAMASGLPVICSKIRGNTDLVKNMYNGILSENNVEALANNINTLVTGKVSQDKLANNAVKTMKNYDLEVVVKELMKVYQEA